MAKTYVPTLRVVIRTAYKYAVRWFPELSEHLTEPQVTCLSSLIQAMADCLVLLGETPIED
jgi:hypothetical protein